MKKLFLLITIVSLALTCCRSREPKWILINDDSKLYLFVEQGSIKHISDNIIRAWFTFAFKQPQVLGPKSVQRALSHDEIDCAKHKVRSVQVIVYFTDGTKESLSEELSSVDIKRGSPQEVEFTYLCKK